MTRATYQNIRKLCRWCALKETDAAIRSGAAIRPETILSCDVSTQLLFSGASSSLSVESCGIRPIYSLRPLSSDKKDAGYSKLLNYDDKKYEFLIHVRL